MYNAFNLLSKDYCYILNNFQLISNKRNKPKFYNFKQHKNKEQDVSFDTLLFFKYLTEQNFWKTLDVENNS